MRHEFRGLAAAALSIFICTAAAQNPNPPTKTTAAKKAPANTSKQTASAGKAVPRKAAPTKAATSKAAVAGRTGATAKAGTTKSAAVNGKTPPRTTLTAKNGKKTPVSRPAAPTWRNRQVAPTADRYREIQQALAAKGYMKSEDITGAWDQNSTEALKKFQADQKLESSGKINSLSLIALGLGPKHTAEAAAPAAPPTPAEVK